MTPTEDLTNNTRLCGALYLTQPGPLWSTSAATTPAVKATPHSSFTDIRPRQCAHAANELATHAPDRPYVSAHNVHVVWGQWIPGYRPVLQPYTSAQRDHIRPTHMRYLQSHSGSQDRTLDAYLKTVPAPTNAEVGTRKTATGVKAHALAAADAMPSPLHPLTRASSISSKPQHLGGPFRDHAATAASAPLAVAMTARRGRTLPSTAVRAEVRRVKRARLPAPVVHTRAVPTKLQVGFRVQPNRFAAMAPATDRPPISSVVTHPWAVTAYSIGRIERHLLDNLQTNTHTNHNAFMQRQEVKRRVQWVRTTLRRLRELADWQAACAPGTDLLQPHKMGRATTAGDAPPCPTPGQWRHGLLAQFDRLCPQIMTSADIASMWTNVFDTLDAGWWYGGGRHAAFVTATTVSPDVAPLLAHMASPPPHQLNDAARRAYVQQHRPHASDADRSALVQAGEWYARFVLASDTARRKEFSIPSWTLTYAASTLAAQTASTEHLSGHRPAFNRRTRRKSSATTPPQLSPRNANSSRHRRRIRSRSGRRRTPPPSPKKIGGGTASQSISHPSSASFHRIHPVRMDPLQLTHDISVSRTPSVPATCTATGQCGGGTARSKPNKASGNSSSKKGGARTIVLDTRVSGTTTASLAGKSSKSSGKKGKKTRGLAGTTSTKDTTKSLVTVTKQGNTTKTPKHRLTEAEVAAYRTGLHKHVKMNGGRAYVEEQQTQQQRKAPAFDFVQLFPKDSPFLKTIPGKLRKSARNRNALRRVKREVLRTYGYHKSATYKRCIGGSHSGAASKDPLVGGGASRRRSSPRLQDGQSVPHNDRKDGYTGALYTRKHRSGGSMSMTGLHNTGNGANMPRVSWVETLSTGEQLTDTSAADIDATQGLSALDLGGLESVVVG